MKVEFYFGKFDEIKRFEDKLSIMWVKWLNCAQLHGGINFIKELRVLDGYNEMSVMQMIILNGRAQENQVISVQRYKFFRILYNSPLSTSFKSSGL